MSSELPNAVVHGWAAHSFTGTGTEGEAHALVAVSFDFSVTEEHRATQSFIMTKDDANRLRKALKHPTNVDHLVDTDPSEEDQ